MLKLSKLDYPVCPECKTMLNDMGIFDLAGLNTPYFRMKTCPVCSKQFMMRTRLELKAEVVQVDQD